MDCPVDGTQLAMSERQGIEIDYCPKCRGVWLDRGELDKIIEKSAAQEMQQHAPAPQAPQPPPHPGYAPAPQAPQPPAHPGYAYGERGEYGEYGERGERGYGHGYRRKSWLSEIFD